MCGICGVFGKVTAARVEPMVTAMNHRGPDDRGVWCDGIIGIGMARLSILDLTAAAHQPMCNDDKSIWLVYNGETYNFQSERQHLKSLGYGFKSHSDSEVVLKLYEQYGDDFLLRLRGMFALAVYDKRGGLGRERLLLARDHLGIKPLLYSHANGQLVFASEMKSLLASGLVEAKIDLEAVRQLLTYGSICQPRTMLQGVKMLPPAHRLVVEQKAVRMERYWGFGLDRVPEARNLLYEEQVQAVAELLEESVRLQMVSDVPVGAFLSGGVDSSLLVGLMTRIAGSRVKTFSVGFAEEGASLDETDAAAATARFLGTDHNRIEVSARDMRDNLLHIVSALDQPTVDGVNSYFVSMAARKSVTVAISGTGGDEVFAGYPWYAQMASWARLHQSGHETSALRARMARWASAPIFDPLVCGRFADTMVGLRNDNGFLAAYGNTFQVFGAQGAIRLLAKGNWRPAGAGRASVHDISLYDELVGADPVERVTSLCMRGYTNNQLLRDIDAVSMAHSLEVRVPFLDVPLIDLALSLPPATKLALPQDGGNPYSSTYRESGSKKILIDAGRLLQVLPESIDCQPKRGFSFPINHWLAGIMREAMEDLLSPAVVESRGIFDPHEVEQVKNGFLAGRIYWGQPWLLMITELWCRSTLDTMVKK